MIDYIHLPFEPDGTRKVRYTFAGGLKPRMIEMTDEQLVLLPLARAARSCCVTQEWLRGEAEAERIPCLKAGKRFLFNVRAVKQAMLQLAEKSICGKDFHFDEAQKLNWRPGGALGAECPLHCRDTIFAKTSEYSYLPILRLSYDGTIDAPPLTSARDVKYCWDEIKYWIYESELEATLPDHIVDASK